MQGISYLWKSELKDSVMKMSTVTYIALMSTSFAATQAAEIQVDAPFAHVYVGSKHHSEPRVLVRAPFVHIALPERSISATVHEFSAPQASESVRQPGELPPPPHVLPLTHYEFAKVFQPRAGNYEVELLHPYSKRPVQIRFTLPYALLEEIDVKRDELKFEYDDYEVEIDFKKNGRVEVDYDD